MRTGGERSGAFQFGHITLGARRVHRTGWKSGAQALSSVGKDRQRRAEAGLMEVGEDMSLRAAIRPLCGRRPKSGDRHDTAARISTGVVRKQSVTHLYTCRHWTKALGAGKQVSTI